MNNKRMGQNSYFDGSIISYIGWVILGVFMMFFTLGLAYPWVITNIYRWEINHTVINGKRHYFSGTGMGLFAQWLNGGS